MSGKRGATAWIPVETRGNRRFRTTRGGRAQVQQWLAHVQHQRTSSSGGRGAVACEDPSAFRASSARPAPAPAGTHPAPTMTGVAGACPVPAPASAHPAAAPAALSHSGSASSTNTGRHVSSTNNNSCTERRAQRYRAAAIRRATRTSSTDNDRRGRHMSSTGAHGVIARRQRGQHQHRQAHVQHQRQAHRAMAGAIAGGKARSGWRNSSKRRAATAGARPAAQAVHSSSRCTSSSSGRGAIAGRKGGWEGRTADFEQAVHSNGRCTSSSSGRGDIAGRKGGREGTADGAFRAKRRAATAGARPAAAAWRYCGREGAADGHFEQAARSNGQCTSSSSERGVMAGGNRRREGAADGGFQASGAQQRPVHVQQQQRQARRYCERTRSWAGTALATTGACPAMAGAALLRAGRAHAIVGGKARPTAARPAHFEEASVWAWTVQPQRCGGHQ
ncbi:hypothetical protein C8J57DRAFT_1521245 [Mycena rebaudengoi]|nr:hypothetical protein C8J57DRAFT_1521245 [Mycena rebaudengoi]